MRIERKNANTCKRTGTRQNHREKDRTFCGFEGIKFRTLGRGSENGLFPWVEEIFFYGPFRVCSWTDR